MKLNRCRFRLRKKIMLCFIVMFIIMTLGLIKLIYDDGNCMTASLLYPKVFNDILKLQKHMREYVIPDQDGFDVFMNVLTVKEDLSEHPITLVSQCSFNQVEHLLDLNEAWTGPISVAVFADSQSLLATIFNILQLQRCISKLSHVTLHLVTPSHTADEIDVNQLCTMILNQSTTNCQPESLIKSKKNYALKTPYPVNILRNTAKYMSRTNLIFIVDIDMIPSPYLATKLATLLQSENMAKTVLVVPAFEMAEGEKWHVPNNKMELTSLVHSGAIRPFYHELCAKCQAPTNYTRWLSEPSSEEMSVLYSVQWRDPWEPFYIASRDVPDHDKRFKQYGFNRISQVCELHIAGYEFKVLSNAFLIHKGLKTNSDFHSTKENEQEDNRILFRQFKQELKTRYPNTRRRCY